MDVFAPHYDYLMNVQEGVVCQPETADDDAALVVGAVGRAHVDERAAVRIQGRLNLLLEESFVPDRPVGAHDRPEDHQRGRNPSSDFPPASALLAGDTDDDPRDEEASEESDGKAKDDAEKNLDDLHGRHSRTGGNARLTRRLARAGSDEPVANAADVLADEHRSEFLEPGGRVVERYEKLFAFPCAERDHAVSQAVRPDELAAQLLVDEPGNLQHLPVFDWDATEQHRSNLERSVPRTGGCQTLAGRRLHQAVADAADVLGHGEQSGAAVEAHQHVTAGSFHADFDPPPHKSNEADDGEQLDPIAAPMPIDFPTLRLWQMLANSGLIPLGRTGAEALGTARERRPFLACLVTSGRKGQAVLTAHAWLPERGS